MISLDVADEVKKVTQEYDVPFPKFRDSLGQLEEKDIEEVLSLTYSFCKKSQGKRNKEENEEMIIEKGD